MTAENLPPSEDVGYTRDESEAHALDRNYGEQLQELRIAETGVQVIFAFLLAIGFQARFGLTDGFQLTVYIITLMFAAIATVLLITPAAYHRLVFRQRRKDELVRVTNLLALGGMSFLLLTVLGAVLLVVDFVTNRGLAIGLTSLLALIFGWFWFALPMRRKLWARLHGDNGSRER